MGQHNRKNIRHHKPLKKQIGGATGVPALDEFLTNSGIDRFFTSIMGTDWQTHAFKYLFVTVILLFVVGLMIMIVVYPGNALYNIQKYFFLIAIPLTLIFAVLLNLTSDTNALNMFFKIASIMIIIGVFVYYYSISTGSIFVFNGYLKYTLLIVIGVIALALIYQTVVSYMEKLQGWPGFIAKLIFYVPCIVWDLWFYLFQQFQLTPFAVYAFILLEAVFILTYVFMPNMINSVTGLTDGMQLLDGIYWLNQPEKVIATSTMLKQIPTYTEVLNGNTGQFRSNYCISMWVYINPQTPSFASYNVETQLFNYGFTDASGVQHVKPMICYYGGGNGTDQPIERNKFVFYFSKYPPTEQYDTSGDTFYDLSLPNQKWNQIVLNYNRNMVDLFINGSLERSFNMANHIPVYSPLDAITVGSQNGMDGAICNVAYYNHPLSESQITFSYNTLMNSNPPTSRVAAKQVNLGPGTSITSTK
jgi:hypothetical protein